MDVRDLITRTDVEVFSGSLFYLLFADAMAVIPDVAADYSAVAAVIVDVKAF